MKSLDSNSSHREQLVQMKQLKDSEAYKQIELVLQEKYNTLFNEAVLSSDEATQRVFKLEQMKGIAYAMGVAQMLISELEDKEQEDDR